MPDLGGITYQDLPGSGTINYGRDGITAKRLIQVTWGDADAFVRLMLGYTEEVGGVPIRTVGQRYPDFDYLWATTASIEGIGELQPGAPCVYPLAKIVVGYEGLRYGTSVSDGDPDADADIEDPRRYLRESYDFGGDFISVPGSKLEWVVDAEVLDEAKGIRDPTIVLMLEANLEPWLEISTITSLIGLVNSTPWYGHAAECVLFDGAAAARTLSADGTPGWTISYRFIAKWHSWNWFFRGTGGWSAGWQEVQSVAEPGFPSRPLYGSGNFALLIDA